MRTRADPCDPQTFERSKLDWSEKERNIEALALHRDLFRLRREDPVFAAQRADRPVLGAAPHRPRRTHAVQSVVNPR